MLDIQKENELVKFYFEFFQAKNFSLGLKVYSLNFETQSYQSIKLVTNWLKFFKFKVYWKIPK